MVWSSPCTKLAIFSISIVVRLFPSPFSATIDDTKLWSFKNFQQEFLFAKITNNIREKLKISLSFGWFSFWSEFLNFSSSVLHSATVCLVKSTNWSHSRAFYQLWMVILLILHKLYCIKPHYELLQPFPIVCDVALILHTSLRNFATSLNHSLVAKWRFFIIGNVCSAKRAIRLLQCNSSRCLCPIWQAISAGLLDLLALLLFMWK